MKSKVLAFVVVFSLLACSINLMAKERRGAELVITKIDGQQIAGELIAVRPASLLLLDSLSSSDISIAVEDIEAITVVKKSKAILGAGIGLSIGLVAGLIIGGTEETIEGTRIEAMAIYAAAIGGPAILLGAILGAVSGVDKQI